jgi:signal transduction histidine kinase
MGFLEIAALAAVVFNTALALLVVRTDIKSLLHRAYISWAVSLGIWNLACCFLYQHIDPQSALFWGKILQLGVIYMPVALLHVCLILTNSPRGHAIKILYGLHTVFALTLFGNQFTASVRETPYGYWTIGGPIFYLFLISYFVCTVWLVIALYVKRRGAPPAERSGLTAMLLGVFCLWICGSNDLLPILGTTNYPFTTIHFFPLGNLAANFYAVLVAYSVLQHELLDIHITMSKAAARLVRLSFVFVIALVLLLAIWAIAPGSLNAISFVIALMVVMATSTVASVLFPRLFGSGADSIERRLLGDRFEYHDRIRAFINSVQESGDATQLLEGLDELLTKVVRVSGYRLVMIEDSSRKFTLLQEYPARSNGESVVLQSDSPLLTYFRITGSERLALNLPSENRYNAEQEQAARAALAATGSEFCFPFMVSTEPFGILFIEERAEGKRYTATDIQLLGMLARNLSLALNQIRLKNQILQSQESELLGRMSRGMAHDMNNLVTPVQTLLQLIAEGIPIEGLRDELLPLASRSIETLREYIREALFFSENARGDFKLGRLDMILAEAVDIVSRRCEQKGIKINVSSLGEALVELDKTLIKRTIANVLSNAIDASSSGSEIHVELSMLEKSEPDRDWYRVCIIDQGEGIAPENMKRIFNPYFTTKNRGDEQRGFGLGLSICRKVIQIHGGSLKLTSALKKGTTVTIDLPDRQLRNTQPNNLQPVS